ncbi:MULTISPECIES: four-helix bundle copper-binding protein [Kosakonia]|uniref:Four-helix bundle copper-binding protein n=1 Tax=Kosakonia quasisacchari TaxID=2529380 RepID=A0A4R0H7E2_9ENTR|nr:four-helix bundle copper-binding protein [Kosakonia quasisacchari]TCC06815.1 four-helix bundle copper-binding protein [Kosakonia quasisacchari]
MHTEHQRCAEACYQCAAACEHCALSCLQEKNIDMMRECIKLDVQCAALCRLAGQFMALESKHLLSLCRICVDVCKACAEECSKHQLQHCQQCAKRCRVCAEACLQMTA